MTIIDAFKACEQNPSSLSNFDLSANREYHSLMDVITRRGFLVGGAVLAAGGVHGHADDVFATIEDRLGGRMGFSALDTHTGKQIRWRADERFAMCSTFKAALAAAVLARIDRGVLLPNHTLNFDPANLLSPSRASAQHPDGRISVIEACEGVVTVSDNTAANALLDLIGGPTVMTDFFRSLGDQISRLDRYEMELNTNVEGDVRDTTTPGAMLHTLQALLLGSVLSDASRGRLTEWMLNEQNGRARACWVARLVACSHQAWHRRERCRQRHRRCVAASRPGDHLRRLHERAAHQNRRNRGRHCAGSGVGSRGVHPEMIATAARVAVDAGRAESTASRARGKCVISLCKCGALDSSSRGR